MAEIKLNERNYGEWKEQIQIQLKACGEYGDAGFNIAEGNASQIQESLYRYQTLEKENSDHEDLNKMKSRERKMFVVYKQQQAQAMSKTILTIDSNMRDMLMTDEEFAQTVRQNDMVSGIEIIRNKCIKKNKRNEYAYIKMRNYKELNKLLVTTDIDAHYKKFKTILGIMKTEGSPICEGDESMNKELVAIYLSTSQHEWFQEEIINMNRNDTVVATLQDAQRYMKQLKEDKENWKKKPTIHTATSMDSINISKYKNNNQKK